MQPFSFSRRSLLTGAATATASTAFARSAVVLKPPLSEFGYADVHLMPGLAQSQFVQTQSILLSLDDDSLLKPWRLRAGLSAPGAEMGGWYDELPLQKTESGGHGFAPGHSFGQWLSALARGYAINRDAAAQAKLKRLLNLYEPAISERFYTNFRFPAYNFDKMVIGLTDAYRFGNVPGAKRLLELTASAAIPHLPSQALDRDAVQRAWRQSVGENTANDYTWDESYTLPENLYIASQSGMGERYRQLAPNYLLDRTYFDPLSENKNVLAHHHAYSFCNALSSAMQAYLSNGSVKHLAAARNAFEMITATQSFATGGWGPDESFSAPESGGLYKSLQKTQHGFETPCGSYAHAKLIRYLLRVTQDGRYGDSLERVLYNTVLGAAPLQKDGRAFYYSDYHSPGRKTYFTDAWPCCSGTLPQVAADYRLMIYLRDADRLFVNLYLPSRLQWTTTDGAEFALEQSGDYPFDGQIKFRLHSARASDFTVHLRIPGWTGASASMAIRVNGQRISVPVTKGFAALRRSWKSGDKIDLDLPLATRLEPIDAAHPQTVALLRGPLVLFPLTDKPPTLTGQQLLSSQRLAPTKEWQTQTSSGVLKLRPFTEIGEQSYMTYLNVT